MNKKYVITGGPGVGKTSVLEVLQKRGYKCVDEVAREIIKEQIATGGEALPWKDTVLYTKMMLVRSVISYRENSFDTKVQFFDRGIPDTLAYSYIINLEDKEEILEASKIYRYNQKVFMLPPWKDIYCVDTERKQTWEEAVETYHIIKRTYQEIGYTIIEVPFLSVEERADFIIQEL